MRKLYKSLSTRGTMNKKGIVPLLFNIKFVVVALLLIGGIWGYYSGAFDPILRTSLSIYDSQTFVKPQWARLECSAEDFPTNNIQTINNQALFRCNANTENCNFQIRSIAPSGRNVYPAYQECDNNGGNCGSLVQPTGLIGLAPQAVIQLPMINNGRSYLFSSVNRPACEFINACTPASNYIRITESHNAFKLFRYYGGARDLVNSFDCTIQTGDLSRIRQSDYTTQTLQRTGGAGQKWINYVNDWVYGPATNIVTYNGQQAYCADARVYSIVQVQMRDGNLVKLDPTYSATLPAGQQLNGLGSVIANVECCPNEPNCGSDFQYNPIQGNNTGGPAVCFSDLQCLNGGGNVPIDGTHYTTYSCITGSCQANAPILVQCTTNAQCSNGQICDLSTNNYGRCITQNQGPYCGDGTCQVTENNNLCANDCAFQCPTGQVLVEDRQYDLPSLLGFTEPDIVRFCKSLSFWEQFGLWIVIGLAFALLFVFLFVKRSIPLVLTVLGLFIGYLGYYYLGTFATTFIIILIVLGFFLFITRKFWFGLLRLLV